MTATRVAVIGTGHLGRYHVQKYAHLKDAELRAVVDIDAEAVRPVAEQYGAAALTDYRDILSLVDAVSVVTPANTHQQIVRDCLLAGVDVLVEKPITPELNQAEELVSLARERGRILQVGHLERFNPLMPALKKELRQPLFLECHRIAPFKPRGTDVDVLLDLMIHDIDLVLNLVDREVIGVEATGAPVLSDLIDIANARIRFEGGGIANITASRISMKCERKLRIFERDTYISADLSSGQLSVFHRVIDGDGKPQIAHQEARFEGDPLRVEIEAFLHSVRTREAPPVDGEQGLRALEVTLEVRNALEAMAIWGKAGDAFH